MDPLVVTAGESYKYFSSRLDEVGPGYWAGLIVAGALSQSSLGGDFGRGSVAVRSRCVVILLWARGPPPTRRLASRFGRVLHDRFPRLFTWEPLRIPMDDPAQRQDA